MAKRSVNIPQDVVNVLQTNRYSYEVWGYSSGLQLLWSELPMRRTSRVTDECASISNIDQVAHHLCPLDEPHASRFTTLDTKS